ncbi:MAG: response regulator [Thermoplasmatales archaeon]|nr:response regulator [Thermoplasmatales archaeon]
MAENILVVDDDAGVQKMFKDVLESYDYRVVQATSGEEALEKYRESKPDIVIMDILMPGMDGVKTTKKLLNQDKNAKIVVVTAVGKPGLEKSCIKAGAKAFIKKPFKIDQLLKTIQNISKEGGIKW